MKVSFVSSLLFGLFICPELGCYSGSQQNLELQVIDSVYKQVMAIHDEVMPKMGYIVALQDSLKQIAQTDFAIQDQDNDPRQLINDLAAAEEGMWVWMNNLKQIQTLSDSLNPILYYTQQIDSITAVKQKMLESIVNAESFIKSIEKQ